MTIVIYFDKELEENQFGDEIDRLEKRLINAGYQCYRQPYDDWKQFGYNRKNVHADGYVFTPGGTHARRKLEKHWMHKYKTNHKLPIVLYDCGEDFDDIALLWLKWCFDNDLKPGQLPNWYSITTSVHETIGVLSVLQEKGNDA